MILMLVFKFDAQNPTSTENLAYCTTQQFKQLKKSPLHNWSSRYFQDSVNLIWGKHESTKSTIS